MLGQPTATRLARGDSLTRLAIAREALIASGMLELEVYALPAVDVLAVLAGIVRAVTDEE
jgi:hypothetical protein